MLETAELDSPALGTSAGCDRFEATMLRALKGARRYHVFCLERGLLLLDVGSVVSAGEQTGMIVGGILGGVVGCMVGSSIGKNLDVEPDWTRHLKDASLDEILAVASQRKHSLVLKSDEIDAIVVEATRWYDSLFQTQKSTGFVRIRDRAYGNLKLQLHDAMSMNAAIDALPKFLTDRVQVKAYFDMDSCTYRSC